MSKYITSFQNYSSYSSGYNNLDKPNVSLCVEEKKVYYNPVLEKDKYLRFYALEDGTFQFTNNINYSLDGGETWQELTANTDSPIIKTGDYIWWKATLTPSATSGSEGIGRFSSSGQYNAMGNPLSLRLGDNFKGVTTMPNERFMFAYLFNNNINLVDASNLSLISTVTRDNCYRNMFSGCSSLTYGPELPATNTTSSCYQNMFSGCSNLIEAPYINLTSAGYYSMNKMFYGCSSLISIPRIPNINGAFASANMFYGCINLTSVPSFTVTYGDSTANNMFYGCTSLVRLDITFSGETANGVSYMFTGCSKLEYVTDELPATHGKNDCYRQMFKDCTSLITAPEIALTSVEGTRNCSEMFRNCASLTTAPSQLKITTIGSWCYEYMFSGCTSLQVAPEILATAVGTSSRNECQYMFNGCSSLITPPPSLDIVTTGQYYTYECMFLNCTSLTTTPEINTINFRDYCCYSMFQGCTSLITACEFNQNITLSTFCFHAMFSGCTSLTTAYDLPSTTLATNCYRNMFSGCTALVNVPQILPATQLTNDCYNHMFYNCKSLERAPELPAATYTSNAYLQMFDGCTSLLYIKCLLEGTNRSITCFARYAKSGGTFVKHPDATWVNGNNGIPTGWTIEDAIIETD